MARSSLPERCGYRRRVPRPVPQRLGAYAVCHDADGAVLLVRVAAGHPAAGSWGLPGGTVAHGEHPRATVAREVHEETGLRVSVGDPVGATGWTDGAGTHHVAVVFAATALDDHAPLRDEVGGASDRAAWCCPDDLATLPVLPASARFLGLPSSVPVPEPAAYPAPGPEDPESPGDGRPVVRQRIAAYAVVLDGSEAMLLTELSDRTAAPGRWTLPGGGLDHGEDPAVAVVREVREETGHDVVVDRLLTVDSTHFTGRAPSGVEEDFHGVRLVYAVHPVEVVEPVVLDEGGTTAAARWVRLEDVERLDLVPLAKLGLSLARRSVRG